MFLQNNPIMQLKNATQHNIYMLHQYHHNCNQSTPRIWMDNQNDFSKPPTTHSTIKFQEGTHPCSIGENHT